MAAVQVLKWRPRGPVGFAPIDETKTPHAPTIFTPFDCVDSVSLSLSPTFALHNAKCGPIDAEDFRMIKDLTATVAIQLTNFTPANLLLALMATSNVAEPAPVVVVNEVLPTIPADGGIVALGGAYANYGITSLVITDSTGSPLTLATPTNYTFDAQFGLVTFPTAGAFVQPFKASYSHQNPQLIAAFGAGEVRRWVRFNGTNYANQGKVTPVNLFNVSISPTKALELEPDDHGILTLDGALLLDQSRAANDVRGQFFDIGLA